MSDVQAFVQRAVAAIAEVWLGPSWLVETALVALLAKGHVLIEDVPGVGKTLLARSLSRAVGGDFKRVQFTPDLMPSDITGFSLYDQAKGTFAFQRGPVFTHVLLADEINRAVPRTQASLLEAMAEGAVSVDGVTYDLPRPFWVLATQNPIDSEGTFPLPEAQRDRFLLQLPLGYPSLADEAALLDRYGNSTYDVYDDPVDRITPVATPEQVVALQSACRHVTVSEPVRDYLLGLVRASREHDAVLAGASPRAALALLWASQARAAAKGRDFVLPDDVKALAPLVLAHRLVLKPQAAVHGRTAADVVKELLEQEPVPVES